MELIYSHTKNDEGSKRLVVHTQGVLEKALGSFYRGVRFTESSASIQDFLQQICLYHDLGKYTDYFQDYLLKRKEVSNELKQHARIGAYALYEKYRNQSTKTAFWAYYLIVNHHKNLSDIKDTEFHTKNDSHCTFVDKVFPKQSESLKSRIEMISAEMQELGIEKYLQIPNQHEIVREIIKITNRQKKNIENYFYINYLFSLLIEADKLDASDTPLYPKKSIDANLVDLRYPIDNTQITGLEVAQMSQNQLRNYVRMQVMSKLDTITDERVYTLTAPTGIGKTMTALDFALKLRAKISAKEHREAQIIYGLPFINIIEQSISEYDKVIGDKAQVLAHYQYADALEQISGEEEEKNYNTALMTLDTWQCDVVITSFVQLLQTLIGNRNKLLKKFNHFAGAIIILDEVQTIKLSLQPLIGASLYYLAKFLDARVLLMTATKPKIFDLAQQHILNKYGLNEQIKPIELLDAHSEVFQCFKRTKIVPILRDEDNLSNEEDFLRLFLDKWQIDKSCLIVCNLVRRSIDITKCIEKELRDKGLDNAVYYLSTNIVPAQRQQVIEQIRQDLKKGLKPILVATQCVEAGVDLDFDMGFRDLAPIDSIISRKTKNKLFSQQK